MIEVACEQGDEIWQECRLGIPTASNFARIVTPGGKASAQAEEYLCELLAEYFLEQAVSEFGGTIWTERGQVMEPEARQVYAFMRDVEPRKAGFVYRDEDKLVGCSPDWLMDPDGCGEIKCPDAGRHLMYLAQEAIPKAYIPQVQGQLWVTGRAYADFVSYFPGLPTLIVRAEPDEKYQAAFDKHIPTFIETMLERREALRSKGISPVSETWKIKETEDGG